jgi:hypothetical protein
MNLKKNSNMGDKGKLLATEPIQNQYSAEMVVVNVGRAITD